MLEIPANYVTICQRGKARGEIKMKKILILSVTAGNGHNACAKSMKRKLEALESDVEVKIVDLLKEYSTKMKFWVADSGYSLAVSKLLPIFNYFYNVYKKKDPNKRYSCSAQGAAVSTVEGLLKEILDFQPDVIYCTHFYAGIALTDLKLVYDLPCKTVISNLDYVNSPFWEASVGVDYFAIPNEDFIAECIEEGYKEEQLLCFGLPVDERTLDTIDKAVARAELGLDNDTFTIMVMFGGGQWSGGLKIFKNLIKALGERKAQVIMINGRNKAGYDKIEKMKFPDNIKVVNVGFTDKVPLYLSAADVIINKFGGTSVTEMLNQGLPMLITEKTPAQEKYNLVYMKEKGVALSFKNKKELKEGIIKLMDNPDLRMEMSQKALSMKRRGIETLAKFMLDLPNADYSKILNDKIDLTNVKKTVKKALKKADKTEKKKGKEKN